MQAAFNAQLKMLPYNLVKILSLFLGVINARSMYLEGAANLTDEIEPECSKKSVKKYAPNANDDHSEKSRKTIDGK